MSKIVKVTLDEGAVALLDRQAAAEGVHRSDVIRARILRGPANRSFSPDDYYRLVAAACRTSDLPRNQVERLVNFVFNEVMGPRSGEASPD